MKFHSRNSGPSGLGRTLLPVRESWRLMDPRQLFTLDAAHVESECRRMAFATYVGDKIVLCRTLGRFKMYVSTLDEGLGPHLIGDGYWEMWTTKVMTELVKPGMVCIDAGANVGYYSVLMADLVGPKGRVIAAEPVPATRGLLQRNLHINGYSGHAEVLGAAFGAEVGEVTLYIPPGEPKNAMICDFPPHPDWEAVPAPVQPIDDLDLPRVDFIKIDVEGAEIDVWRGMQKTIDRNPDIKIMMEVNCGRYPTTASSFLAEIEARFPLRSIDFAGAHVPITAAQVQAYPDDVMLYLGKA